MAASSFRGEAIQRENIFEVTPCITGINNNESCVTTVSDFPTAITQNSGGCSDEDYSSRVGLTYSVVCAGVALFLENSLLIFVIASNKSLYTNTNILVASLAVTDLVVGIQCCLIGLTGLSVGIRSLLATINSDLHAFDMLMLSISVSLVGVSLLHVFCLAVDRYLFVLWPFHYRQCVTRSRVLAVAAAIWILGLVYTLLPLVLYHDTRHRQTCILSEIPSSFGYVPVGCVYLICLVVVTYCTTGLVKIARQHRAGRVRKRIENKLLKCRRSEPNLEETVLTMTCKSKQIESASNVDTESSHVDMRSEEQIQELPLPTSSPLNVVETRVTDENIVSKPGKSRHFDSGGYNNLHYVKEETMNSSGVASSSSANTEKQEMGFPSLQATNSAEIFSEANDTASLSAKNEQKHVSKDTADNTIINQPVTTMKNTLNNDTDNELVFCPNKSQDDRSRLFDKSNIKIIKFVVVVFGTFFACTFPPVALLSLVKIFNLPLFNGNDFAVDFLRFLVMINSSVNFLTITYMNKEFRRALLKSVPFCKVCFCDRKVK